MRLAIVVVVGVVVMVVVVVVVVVPWSYVLLQPSFPSPVLPTPHL